MQINKFFYVVLLAVVAMIGCQTNPPQDEVKVVYPEEVKYAEIQDDRQIDRVAPSPVYQPVIEERVPPEELQGPPEKEAPAKKTATAKKSDPEPKAEKAPEVKPGKSETAVKEMPKETKEVATAPKSETKTEVAATPKPVSPAPNKGKKFHLRVISLPHHEYYYKQACAIAEFIKKTEGLDYAITRTANDKSKTYWVVDVGGFDSMKNEDAKKLQSKIQNTKYEGILQFRDAYYVAY